MEFQTAGRGRPPILFVHGFACDGSDWRGQFDRLQKNHRVVVCDLRGHGRTRALAKDGSVETCAADVASLLGKLDLPPTLLVGHSMGCRVVLQGYRNAPDRVAGIVLLEGSRVASGARSAAEAGMAQQLRRQGYQNFLRRFFEEMFLASSAPKLKAAILKRAERMPEELGAPLLCNVAGWDAAEAIGSLESVRVPLLAIQTTCFNAEGVRIPLSQGQTSSWLDLVGERVPGARIETLTHQGHFPQLESPAAIDALLEDFVLSCRAD